MYGKFFASTFTGSMFGAGPDVFAVWGYVIANAVESQVELNPALLAAVIGTSPERITAAIEKLCAPDPLSRTKTHDGKRLVREGEYAYNVPNLLAYRSIRNEEERREYNRVKKAEQRERDKVKDSVIDMSAVSAQAVSSKQRQEAEALSSSHRRDLIGEPAYHDAYLALRAKAGNPASFDAMLGTLEKPISGGPAYGWTVIGQALLEIHSTGGKASPNSIRAFCRKLTQPEQERPNGKSRGMTADKWEEARRILHEEEPA